MDDFHYLAALVLLAAVAASLIRVHLGPSRADRMISAQLMGTGGVATSLLLAGATRNTSMIDVALVLALLAAFAAVAFVKASSTDGAGDPEEGE
jgi:multicomponent Na+:H+ antiporter subunit F